MLCRNSGSNLSGILVHRECHIPWPSAAHPVRCLSVGVISLQVTTRVSTSRPRRGKIRGTRLLAQQALKALCMIRSCQRQTYVFDLCDLLMIALVSTSLGLSRTIPPCHMCFSAAIRFLTRARRRRQSAGETVINVPVSIRVTRTQRVQWESQPGFNRQI